MARSAGRDRPGGGPATASPAAGWAAGSAAGTGTAGVAGAGRRSHSFCTRSTSSRGSTDLRDVVVGADAQPGQAIVDGAPAGEEHQRDAGGVGMPLELPGGGEAVLVGHLHVEEDDRRLARLRVGEDFDPLRHDRHLEAGAVQEAGHQEVLVLVVVGDEDRLASLDRDRGGRRPGRDRRPFLVKALQMSASSRLAAASSKLAPGGAWISSAAASCATEELRRAGPADQAMGRLLQADQGIRIAAPRRRLDHDGQDFEPAREAGDEPPASFVDDFLNLSRRKCGRCRRGLGGPSG
jgi:hypothetical protein